MRSLLCHAFFPVQPIMWDEVLNKLVAFLFDL